MRRTDIYALICEAAELPAGSINGNEVFATLPGWDSLAGVDFRRLLVERWDIKLDGLRVTEARTVGELLGLLRGRLDD